MVSVTMLACRAASNQRIRRVLPYGFLNFKVTVVDHAVKADESTLAGWWADLAGEDSVKAYTAVWKLVATGDTATSFIQTHMPPAPTEGVQPPLNIAQDGLWVYGCFQYDTPVLRQRARAIHVLEVIHSTASDQLLEKIGYKGTPVAAPPDRWVRQ